MSLEARRVLKKHWGYDNFRACQEEIIDSILDGHDTLGLMPTGGGKSITFQVPALMLPGMTVVITPLISLMKDQVDNLHSRHIKAIALHSGLTQRERNVALNHIESGRIKLLYVSPERLATDSFTTLLRRLDISLLVVDEAHCISQWGYDFRPSYLNIASIRKLTGTAPVLALTASATPGVVDDIVKQLKFKTAYAVHRLSFNRSNLSYIVRHVENKTKKLVEILSVVRGTAIVYVRSRKRTIELAQVLAEAGISAEAYHAGLQPELKSERQERWKTGDTRVIVATTAFGMGIDKPDVRLVIHHDIPPSLEEYYQEAGRAGRDGKPSLAVLLTNNTDSAVLSRRLTQAFPSRELIKDIYNKVCVFLNIVMGEGYETLHEFNLKAFTERYELQTAQVVAALGFLERAGYIEYQEDYNSRSRIMVVMNRNELYNLRLSQECETVLNSILRQYTGLFADYEYISESVIASRSHLNEDTVYQSLLTLARMGVIHFIPRKNNPMIFLTRSREMVQDLLIPTTIYEEKKRRMQHQLDAVRRLAFTHDRCRAKILLEYFGETATANCGCCDVCRDNITRDDTLPVTELIIHALRVKSPATVNDLAAITGVTPADIINNVRILADDNLVKIQGTYISKA